MHLMCTSCFDTLRFYEVKPYPDKPYHPYKVGTCKCGGNVCEVDELILPTIIELNNKGWTTEYCCSGHMNEGCVATYIKFVHRPETLPTGFKKDDMNCIRYNNFHIDLRGLEGYEKLLRINRNLYSWATRLPERVE